MGWSPNKPIPHQESKASPALGALGPLQMVYLETDSNQIRQSVYNGSEWEHASDILNQTSKAAPALAAGTMLHLGNTSNKIWRSDWQVGRAWSENRILLDVNPVLGTGGSTVSPALASIPLGAIGREEFAVVYKDSQGSFIHHFFPSSKKAIPTGGLTRAAPAVAFHRGTLHMVHIGESSNQLWHAIWDPSRELWTDSNKVDGQASKASPALAVFNGRLHMVHLGDTSNQLWHSVYIDNLNSWTQDRIDGQTSKAPPALAAFGGRLHMVHLGNTSNQIWHAEWQDN